MCAPSETADFDDCLVNLASPILRNLLADEPSTAEQESEAPPSKAKEDEDLGNDDEFNGLEW
ncbi:hypothetical protein HGRIS_001061 [Hohenbuehelia grisea]|uniref:Uncharacterized protein n=1 Tax=Hohenbuehelia grisea TaxID=104357 RepID=A0ABR3JP46_9AGAR